MFYKLYEAFRGLSLGQGIGENAEELIVFNQWSFLHRSFVSVSGICFSCLCFQICLLVI